MKNFVDHFPSVKKGITVYVSNQTFFRTVVVHCKPPIQKKRYLLLRVRVIKSRDKTNMKSNNSELIGFQLDLIQSVFLSIFYIVVSQR